MLLLSRRRKRAQKRARGGLGPVQNHPRHDRVRGRPRSSTSAPGGPWGGPPRRDRRAERRRGGRSSRVRTRGRPRGAHPEPGGRARIRARNARAGLLRGGPRQQWWGGFAGRSRDLGGPSSSPRVPGLAPHEHPPTSASRAGRDAPSRGADVGYPDVSPWENPSAPAEVGDLKRADFKGDVQTDGSRSE